jgi:hypothetical protein
MAYPPWPACPRPGRRPRNRGPTSSCASTTAIDIPGMANAWRSKSHRRSNSWRSWATRPDVGVTACAPAGRAILARPPSAAAAALPAAKLRSARRSIVGALRSALAMSSSIGPSEPHAGCRKMLCRGERAGCWRPARVPPTGSRSRLCTGLDQLGETPRRAGCLRRRSALHPHGVPALPFPWPLQVSTYRRIS